MYVRAEKPTMEWIEFRGGTSGGGWLLVVVVVFFGRERLRGGSSGCSGG